MDELKIQSLEEIKVVKFEDIDDLQYASKHNNHMLQQMQDLLKEEVFVPPQRNNSFVNEQMNEQVNDSMEKTFTYNVLDKKIMMCKDALLHLIQRFVQLEKVTDKYYNKVNTMLSSSESVLCYFVLKKQKRNKKMNI